MFMDNTNTENLEFVYDGILAMAQAALPMGLF